MGGGHTARLKPRNLARRSSGGEHDDPSEWPTFAMRKRIALTLLR
jgi:hypothetical protein